MEIELKVETNLLYFWMFDVGIDSAPRGGPVLAVSEAMIASALTSSHSERPATQEHHHDHDDNLKCWHNEIMLSRVHLALGPCASGSRSGRVGHRLCVAASISPAPPPWQVHCPLITVRRALFSS